MWISTEKIIIKSIFFSLGLIMNTKETFTFILPKKLKEEFDETCKANQRQKSSILRQLMALYINNPSVLISSTAEINIQLEERMKSLEHSYEKEMEKLRKQFDSFIVDIGQKFKIEANANQKSLIDEIVTILTEDSKVRKQTYPATEKALLNYYPNLESEVLRFKENGQDPTGDAINKCRDSGLVTYSIAKKRLKWSD